MSDEAAGNAFASMVVVCLLLYFIVMPALTVWIAKSKGYGVTFWFILAILTGPIAFLCVLMLNPLPKMVNCPNCAEIILAEAKVCPHCSTRGIVTAPQDSVKTLYNR